MPRAPSGPPPRVRIYAHKDDGTKMRIWWTRPVNNYGGKIEKYIVEWTSVSNDWTTPSTLCNGGACPSIKTSTMPTSYVREWTHETVLKQLAISTISVSNNVATVNHADNSANMLKQGDTITISGMAENVLNSVYTVSNANPTALTLQIQLNAGALKDGNYAPDSNPGAAYVSFNLGGTDGWDYNITGLTAGQAYQYRVVSINDQDRGISYTHPIYPVAVSHVSSTEAIPLCQGEIEDCQPLLIPRRLPLSPTSIVLSEIGTSNEFTRTSLTVTWKSGSITNNVANDWYKVEWDTLTTFDSTGGRPMSYEKHNFSGTSPEVAASAADSNGELSYIIHGLPQGTQIFVRITGKNTLGYGAPSPVQAARPMRSSWAPTAVTLQLRDQKAVTSQQYGTGLDVSWTAPLDTGGDPISRYRVEWGTAAWDAYTLEVQTVKVATAGNKTFRLGFDTTACTTCMVRQSYTTGRIQSGTALTTDQMKTSLENLPNIGTVSVTRTWDISTSPYGWVYSITFDNAVGNQPELTVHTDVSDGAVTVSTITQGTDTEVVNFAVSNIVVVGTTATANHAAVDPIKLKAGDTVTFASFAQVSFNNAWTVTGTPTKTAFTFSVVESSRSNPGANTYSGAGGSTSAVVSGGYCASYSGQSTVCPEITSLDTSPYKYSITGLYPGVKYYARVTPYHSLGYGYTRTTTPASMLPPFQVPTAPTAPFHAGGKPELHVVSASSLVVKFGGPDFNGGDPNSAYKIEWDTAPTFNSGSSPNLPIGSSVIDTDCLSACEHIITGLTAGTRYYVRIAAYNAEKLYGPSTATNPSSEVPRQYPLKPTSVTLEVATSTSLKATWNHLSTNTEYLVESYTRSSQFVDDGIFSDGHFGRRESQTITTATTGWQRESGHMSGSFTIAHDGDEGETTTRFELPGNVSVTRGDMYILTSSDLTWYLNRGDIIRIGTAIGASAEYTISTNMAHTFDENKLPLTAVYAADTMVGIKAWRKEVTTTIPIDASQAVMHAALQNLYTVGQVNVVREQINRVDLAITQFVVDGGSVATATHTSTTYNMIKAGDKVTFPTSSVSEFNGKSFTVVSVIDPTSFTFNAAEHGSFASGANTYTESITCQTDQFRDLKWTVAFISGEGARQLLIANSNKITSTTTISILRTITAVKPANYKSYIVAAPTDSRNTMSYTIESLSVGTPYFVRLSSKNDRGLGPMSPSAPAMLKPITKPAALSSVKLLPWSGTALLLNYDETAPPSGANVTKYKAEWDISPNFDSVHAKAIVEVPSYAVQKVTVGSHTAPLSGTFTLSYGDYLGDFTEKVGGATTFFSLSFGAKTLERTAGTVDMRLAVTRGDFVRLTNAVNDDTYTFQVCTDRTGACPFTASSIPLAAVGNDTDTPYTYMGYTNFTNYAVYKPDTSLGPVSVQSGASGHLLTTMWEEGSTGNDLRTKINRGDLIRLGDPFTGPTFRVSLNGAFTGTSVELATIEDPLITASYSLNEKAAIVYQPAYKLQTTANINWDATAETVKSKLESLTLITSVDVERSILGNGYVWTVTFTNTKPNSWKETEGRIFGTLRKSIEGYRSASGEGGYNAPSHLDIPRQSTISSNNYMLMVVNHYTTLTAPSDVTLTNNPSCTVTVTGFRKMILSGLQTGTPYYARVSAYNEFGWGPTTFSQPTNLSPSNQLPPPPLLARATPVSNTEILVQWKPPLSFGGFPITKYVVEWSLNVDFDSNGGNSIGFQDVPASILTGKAEVQAITTANSATGIFGTFTLDYDGQTTPRLDFDISAAQMEKALNGLSSITDVTVSREVVGHGFTWLVTFNQMTYAGDLSGELTASDVGLYPASATVTVNPARHIIGRLPYHYIITGLTSAPYFVRVSSFNDLGQGESTNAMYGSAPALNYLTPTSQVPMEPQNVTVIVLTSSSVRVTWVAPRSTGGNAISSYKIEWDIIDTFNSICNGGNCLSMSVLGSATQSLGLTYDITNLVPGQQYYIRVSATSSSGTGPVSLANPSPVRPAAVPEAPNNVVLVTDANDAIRVEYTIPEAVTPFGSNGAPVTKYKVEWAQRVHEVQKIKIAATGAIESGQYRLVYSDGKTPTPNLYTTPACIDWNAEASVLEANLGSLTGVDGVTVKRTGDATSAFDYGYEYTVTFNGPYLQSGNMEELTFSTAGCVSWSSASNSHAYTIKTITEGVSGAEQEVVELVTDATSQIGGTMAMSFSYEGTMTEQVCSTCVTIHHGSRHIAVNVNLVNLLGRGEHLVLAGAHSEIYRIHATDTFDATRIPLDRAFVGADLVGVALYKMDTSLGLVTATQGNSAISYTGDRTSLIGVGDSILIGIEEFTVAAHTAGSITISALGAGTSTFTGITGSYTAYKKRIENVAWNANAATLKSKLQLLPGVGTVDVVRRGPDSFGAYAWTITFQSLDGPSKCPKSPCLLADITNAASVATLTGTAASATTIVTKVGLRPSFDNATHYESAVAVPEVQQITVTATRGLLKLQLGTTSTVQNFIKVELGHSGIMATMRHDVTAEDMKFRLEQLSGIGRVAVTRTPSETTYPSDTYSFVYQITFLTNEGDIPMITTTGSTLELVSKRGHDVSPGTVNVIEVTKGVAAAEAYTIPGLSNGARYHVRVAAANDVGYGPWTTTTSRNGGGLPGLLNFPCVTSPCPHAPLRTGGTVPLVHAVRQAPSKPTATVKMISQSQADVSWTASTSNGDEVDKYKVEWFTDQGLSEVKIIMLNNTQANDRRLTHDTAGTWLFTLNGETTARISHDATAIVVKQRIENLKGVTQVAVSRKVTEEPQTFGYIWAVTFVQDIGDIADASLNGNGLHSETGTLLLTIVQDGTGDSVQGTAASNFGSYEMNNHQESCSQTTDQGETGQCSQGNREIQTIVTEASSAMTGTFGLTFRGKRTAEIPVTATAAQVRTQLIALSSVSDVEVTRSDAMNNGYRWYVTFLSSEGPVDSIIVDGSFLGGQDAVINNYDTVVITTTKEQSSAHNISGTFKIHIGSERTPALSFDCSAVTMETELLLFDSVARLDITRTGTFDTFQWIVLFKQHDANLNTLRVVPQADFLGIGAMINVKRPRGASRHSFLIGNRAEIQTLDLQADTSAITAGSFKLSMLDTTGSTVTTGCINWGADGMGSSGTLQHELESLSSVDQVKVIRSGDGTSAYDYGYSYTIQFYGTINSDNVNELSVTDLGSGSCTSFTGGANHKALVHTKFDSSALANVNQKYVALKDNSDYTFRVLAKNDQGYGYASSTAASTNLLGVLPTRPLSMARLTYSDSSFYLHYDAPLHDGGSQVTKYRIEVDTSSTFSSSNYKSDDVAIIREVQSVKTTFSRASGRGGTFQLLWGRHRTSDLPWNAGSDAVSVAVQKITGAFNQAVNPVEVSRTSLDNGFEWKITFNGMEGNVGALSADDDRLLGYNPKVIIEEVTAGIGDITPGDFTYETQMITTEALSNIGGTFTLEFEGYTTQAIAFSASAADMKSKLEALYTIHTVNVKKTQTDLGAGDVAGVTWEVSFTHKVHERIQAAGNIGLLLADSSLLTGTQANVYVTEVIQGTDPFKYKVTGLIAGIPNYVRVFAYNSIGLGAYSDVLTVTPMNSPSAPTSTTLSVVSKSSLKTTWSPPVSTNGSPVTAYKVEWYKEEPSVEVQMVTTSSNGHVEEIQMIETTAISDSIANQFTLSFKGEKTSPMFEDVSAADVKSALERLSTIGTVTVTSDRNNDGYSQRAITGKIDVANGASAITCNSGSTCSFLTDFSRGDLIWVAGEAFRVHLSATFSSTTVPLGTIADNSIAATFAGATVSNVIAYKWAYGHVWHVTFNSGHVGNQEPIVAEPATGWTGADVTLNVFTVREGLQPISGYFTLALEDTSGIIPTTSPIAYDASALDVKVALENLITVGSVDVSRARNGFGYSWMITFQTNLGPVKSLIATGTELTGPHTSISVSKTFPGSLPTGYGSQIITDLSSLSYTISGLTTGSTYMVRIAAKKYRRLRSSCTDFTFV
jgi:hypothetical protein